MQALFACSTFALVVSLAVSRPRLGSRLRLSPASAALAGLVCLLLSGTVRPADVSAAFDTLWRPLVAIVSIMITTAAARHLGVIDSIARHILTPRAASLPRLFRSVFVLSLAISSLFSNDAAVLLLTPLVLAFIQARYPNHPRLLIPFAFAVFMAAGVAPLVISNPMNMVVASYASLNFNEYAAAMIPISLAGSVVTFLLLARLFAADLAAPADAVPQSSGRTLFNRGQVRMVVLLFGVLATYPFVAAFDGRAIWAVAAAGGVLALGLAWHEGHASPFHIVRRGVSWDVIVFLPAVFVLTLGLRNVGLVDVLASWYRDAGLAVIGLTSAAGSAALNNHPMAFINLLALEARPDTGSPEFLAALVGGDLGPRLLPTGSLAGLLWFESCARFGIQVSPGLFMRVGLALTAPTLLGSLMLLALF